jgi:UDP-glucuronate 4-epimerase
MVRHVCVLSPSAGSLMRVLVTGAAGFIGYHVCDALLRRGDQVLGVDSLNDYYDPAIKTARLDLLSSAPGFAFRRCDLSDPEAARAALDGEAIDIGVHLAAQAGVRYSIEHPLAYVDANIRGQINLLDWARRSGAPLLYASSSSVYGERADAPFRETDRCDKPVSVYAASKRSAELMAEVYAGMHGVRAVGLRFFTVYGPWGRPDMAYWLFTDAILAGRPIQLFNNGQMRRDFTDIGDILAGVLAIIDAPPAQGHHLYNIGHSEPVTLRRFVAALEQATGRNARVELAPMQAGDVGDTYADVSKLATDFGYRPSISVEEGLERFVRWFRTWRSDRPV